MKTPSNRVEFVTFFEMKFIHIENNINNNEK